MQKLLEVYVLLPTILILGCYLAFAVLGALLHLMEAHEKVKNDLEFMTKDRHTKKRKHS